MILLRFKADIPCQSEDVLKQENIWMVSSTFETKITKENFTKVSVKRKVLILHIK